jgi:cell division protein FtsB
MNIVIRKYSLIIFFSAEIIILLIYYLFGNRGLPTILQLRREKKILLQEIEQIKSESANLNNAIELLKKFDFYREKIAREQLHMARANDLIYYLPKKEH